VTAHSSVLGASVWISPPVMLVEGWIRLLYTAEATPMNKAAETEHRERHALHQPEKTFNSNSPEAID